MSDYDVCVVGGAGHVGAPLAIVLAAKGMRTLIYDIDMESMKILAGGEMPILEEGGVQLLRQVLAKKMLAFSPEVEEIKNIPVIISYHRYACRRIPQSRLQPPYFLSWSNAALSFRRTNRYTTIHGGAGHYGIYRPLPEVPR